MRLRWLHTIIALGASTLALGCEPPPEGTWVTKLTGTDAWLGISVEGDEAAAFVCGGDTSLDTHTRWMLETVTTEKLVFRQDDFELEVTLTDGDIGGQLVEPSGAAIAFDARRVDEQEVAGVYFGFDSGCGDGLIVLDEDEALGAWCSEEGLRAQVTPVLPFERGANEVSAFVEIMDERRDFLMERVDPGAVTP